MGRFIEALKHHQIALEIRASLLPQEHHEVIRSYENIGRNYEALENHEEAERCFKMASSLKEKASIYYL